MNPLLTIGMPVFNDVQFIEKSIRSILSQSFSNFKLLISDDGSTDGSEEICLKYAATDSRINYYRQPVNIGISRNMEYLLAQANTPYFMWAADDDLWNPDFCEKLIQSLQINDSYVSAFCHYILIDDNDKEIGKIISKNYTNSNRNKRLINFIRNSDDAFGYGIFKTEMICHVRFPVWWWPNRNTPYNNIYPTLAYYLCKGDMAYVSDLLFYKREKNTQNTNHKLVGKGNGLNETIAFIIRRFNLVTFTFNSIKKSSNYNTAVISYPFLLRYWFFKPVFEQIRLASSALLKKINS